MTDETDKPVIPTARSTGRSGRAISSPIPVNTAVSPSGGPSSDDCYTSLLHNPDHDLGSSSGKPSGKQPGGCGRFGMIAADQTAKAWQSAPWAVSSDIVCTSLRH